MELTELNAVIESNKESKSRVRHVFIISWTVFWNFVVIIRIKITFAAHCSS